MPTSSDPFSRRQYIFLERVRASSVVRVGTGAKLSSWCTANFKLPEEGELFDSVEFIELQREESQKLVEQYNKEGEDAGFGQKKGFRGGFADRRGGFMDRRGGYGKF